MLTANRSPGVIERGSLYTLSEVQSRTGWSKHALRAARRAGLPVKYVGGRAFLTGDSILEFVVNHGKDTK